MRKAYTLAQKAEAVALATVTGADAAGAQLGIDPRTIRGWASAAGKSPADAVSPSSWQTLLDLALAKVASALSTGKITNRDAAIIAGIAQRNIRTPAKPDAEAAEEEAELRARERYGHIMVVALRMAKQFEIPLVELLDVLAETLDHADLEADCLVALQTYHQDHGCSWGGHQEPLSQCPAPLPNMWDWLESIAPVDEWLERHREADRKRTEEQLERNRLAAQEYQLRALDAETRSLIESAERYLAENADAA